jgi:hypothetical protein
MGGRMGGGRRGGAMGGARRAPAPRPAAMGGRRASPAARAPRAAGGRMGGGGNRVTRIAGTNKVSGKDIRNLRDAGVGDNRIRGLIDRRGAGRNAARVAGQIGLDMPGGRMGGMGGMGGRRAGDVFTDAGGGSSDEGAGDFAGGYLPSDWMTEEPEFEDYTEAEFDTGSLTEPYQKYAEDPEEGWITGLMRSGQKGYNLPKEVTVASAMNSPFRYYGGY